jgi:hypothetical protein
MGFIVSYLLLGEVLLQELSVGEEAIQLREFF